MDNLVFLMMMVAVMALGALLRPGYVIAKKFAKKTLKSVKKRFEKMTKVSTLTDEVNVVKSKIDSALKDDVVLANKIDELAENFGFNIKNLVLRVEAIEKKIGQVEVDSYGHMIENPTVVPESVKRSVKKMEEAENERDAWKVL